MPASDFCEEHLPYAITSFIARIYTSPTSILWVDIGTSQNMMLGHWAFVLHILILQQHVQKVCHKVVISLKCTSRLLPLKVHKVQYNNSKEYNPEVENSRKLQLMPKCNYHGSSLMTLCIKFCAVVCVKKQVWYCIVLILDSVSSPNFFSCSLLNFETMRSNLLHFLRGWHYCSITFLIVTPNWCAIHVLRMLTQSSISSYLGIVVAAHCMLHESPIKIVEAGDVTL